MPGYRGAMTPMRRNLLVDLGLWFLACAPLIANPKLHDQAYGPVDVLLVVAALALIVARRRWPVPVLAIGLLGAVVASAALGRVTALLTTTMILLYRVAVTTDRRTTIRAGIAGIVSTLACVAILVASDFVGPELLAGLAWPTLAVAVGDAVRSRREALAAAEERAARAEATREEEARRRVAEERLYIARELHDVIAHQIAVVNVQAGVAAHLLRDKPDAAEDALATVRQSARQVLDELAGMLGVLRSDGIDPASVEPAPGVSDLPALLESFDGTGLHIELETTGAPRPLGEATGLAAYRVVQEALTNAHKHGTGSATLRLAYCPDGLEITVTNPSAAAGAAGTGFGLIGMRERVQAVSGTIEAGRRADGVWEVRAVLPAHRIEGAR